MSQPADRCPYQRPFPLSFDGCPAYHPMAFGPVDTFGRLLEPSLTCQHLTTGQREVEDSHCFYARCRLGGPDQRQRWADTVTQQRLAGVRAILLAQTEALGPHVARMREAKARYVQRGLNGAPGDGRDLRRRLREAGDEVIRLTDEFLASRHSELDSLGLPVDACRELTRAVVARYVDSDSLAADIAVPESVLSRFPTEVRPLFRPAT